MYVLLSDEIIVTGGRAIARSYAKINLTLDVLGRRNNGYHDVEMIMQTVSLFDLLIIDKSNGGIKNINIHLPVDMSLQVFAAHCDIYLSCL